MIFQLENKQPFSRSILWKLQRQYFEKMGSDAWRMGEVPHYVTSNQRIANSYAEVIFSFYKDSKKTVPPGIVEPLYILEAGAGSGRFGYYLVKRLHLLCDQENIPRDAFCYIFSDFTQRNPDFWKQHPSFQTYLADGSIEIALFDMMQQEDILLQISGKRINANSLTLPLVFIANYVFDSIPQELYYTMNGSCHTCLVSVFINRDPAGLSAAEVLEEISCKYDYNANENHTYAEPWLNQVLTIYSEHILQGFFFFPEAGIRSLAYLRSFSKNGMLVLTADKGSHEISKIAYADAPEIVKHGSFSLTVNYHALSTYATQSGGSVFFPWHQHSSVNAGCIAFLENSAHYRQTISAFKRHMENAGPDDYFTLYQHLANEIDNMPLKVILSLLRFSMYDSHLLGVCLPRLHVLGAEIQQHEKEDVITTIAECWNNYFPLGEQWDLANRIATFCYEIDIFDWAIYYFKMSADIYGNDTGTLFNIAACYQQLGEIDNAKIILDIVLSREPGNTEACSLLQNINSQPPDKIEP